MSHKKGFIVLMGSGELTSTMVEVHKELLASLPDNPKAVFLDTPAGFELNADQISQRAVDYFLKRVQQPMSVVSFKSKEKMTPYEASKTYQELEEAHFVLIGPGSPTYAVRQWHQTPIPDILGKRIEEGGCLVAASAAALTVGRFTLPVYEIYKVGEDLHWVEGMNTLEHFGFNLVVIPHWNNAEGGTHDTRFCYMGEGRLKQLESRLPDDVFIFGLDEHTACLMDLEKDEAIIKGIGSVTLHRGAVERVFQKGERFPLDILRTGAIGEEKDTRASGTPSEAPAFEVAQGSFWDRINTLEAAFRKGLEDSEPREMTNALLELDRTIWNAHEDLESREFISQARDILRELIVSIGIRLESAPRSKADCLKPLVEALLELRQTFRAEKEFKAADAIRESLSRAEIIVEDTKEGSRWKLL
jgi:cyanophycinase-like exopeptidase